MREIFELCAFMFFLAGVDLCNAIFRKVGFEWFGFAFFAFIGTVILMDLVK